MVRTVAGAVSMTGAQSWASMVRSTARAMSVTGARTWTSPLTATGRDVFGVGVRFWSSVCDVCTVRLKCGALAEKDGRNVWKKLQSTCAWQ